MVKSFAKFFLLVSVFSMPVLAMAETVKKTMPACISEELLDELISYAVKGDRNGSAQLLISGKCTMLPAGAEVSIIKNGFTKVAVRYMGDKWFTVAEAIR